MSYKPYSIEGDENEELTDQNPDRSRPDIYQKRTRRKTREDKYDLKVDPIAKSKVSRKKKTRRKKSGTAINHDFRAPNVASERLTVSSLHWGHSNFY